MFFSILDNFFNETSLNHKTMLTNIDEVKKQSYVSDEAVIGANVKIGKGCIIEPGVHIGDNTEIHHNVVIRRQTKVGKNCTIYSGAVIGERGFNPNTQDDGSRVMLNHYGGVTIQDNVHIGENCNISQGSIDNTIIEQGVKLNSNVRVAHNVVIGKNTVVTIN